MESNEVGRDDHLHPITVVEKNSRFRFGRHLEAAGYIARVARLSTPRLGRGRDAVRLYETLTGHVPSWGDGRSDPH